MDYFKKMNNNERSIIFTAFVAEELGGYGSKYFETIRSSASNGDVQS
jgi:Zn-dependent M28 family amino/carboxypeptidase